MASQQPRPPAHAKTFLARLLWLFERHSQAEVARRTKTAPQSVSRYARGGKVPVEFAARLVEAFGVNPAWLLVGEGSAYLVDTGANNAELAGGILGLVQALEAVTKTRLGALVGTDYRRTLRELDRALRRHEALRQTLNTQTAPLLGDLIKRLERAISARDLTQAESLEAAAAQVARLCDDEALAMKFDSARAHYTHVAGDRQKALALQGRLFRRALVPGTDIAQTFIQAHNFIVALYELGRLHEAQRVCRATLELFAGTPGSHGWAPFLRSLSGNIAVHLGDLTGGLAELQHAIVRAGAHYAAVHGYYLHALLASGWLSLDAAASQGLEGSSKHSALIWFACWHEDFEALARLHDRYMSKHAATHPLNEHVRLLLVVADSKAKARRALNDARRALRDDSSDLGGFVRATALTQVARLAGDRDNALELLDEAERRRHRLSDELTPRLLQRANHHRNALLLLPERPRAVRHRRLRQLAQQFFDTYLAAGYGCFRTLGTPPPEFLDPVSPG